MVSTEMLNVSTNRYVKSFEYSNVPYFSTIIILNRSCSFLIYTRMNLTIQKGGYLLEVENRHIMR